MNQLLGWLGPLSVLAALAAALWYVAARLRVAFGWRRRWPARLAVVAVFGAGGAMMGFSLHQTAWWATPSYWVGGQLLVVVLYGVMLLPLAHLCGSVLRRLSRYSRLRPLERVSGPMLDRAALALAGLTVVAGAIHASGFHVVRTEIAVPGLDRELTVVQISDVHLGHHRDGGYLRDVVDATNREHPDLVLITGDLVDSPVALQGDQLAALGDLTAPAYFVAGNHDVDVGFDRVVAAVAAQGVTVMRNDVVHTKGLQLIGLDYMRADDAERRTFRTPTDETIEEVVPRLPIDADTPSVLMHHSPTGIEYLRGAGIDLVLAGHTHGGQVFPGPWVAALRYDEVSGLYPGATQVYVSEGLGTFVAKSRIGTSNQLDVLHLVPGD